MDMNLVKLAVDSYRGKATGNYSNTDNMETLRQALIEANGGSTTFNYKAIRDGKCNGLFALVEEIITKTVIEGLPESSEIFNFVDSKNVAMGDKAAFYVPDNSLLTVANVSDGNLSVRRQKYEFGTTIEIPTFNKIIKVYADLELVLAGRIDFNEFIDRVSKSFQNDINNDILAAFVSTYDKVAAPYQVSGAYDREELMELVDHVEAATGMTAKILGSRQAVRKISALDSNEAKSDVYNMGYVGKCDGVPVFAMKNGHKVGTTDFVLNPNDLYVVAGDDKFIKHVTEGDTTMIIGDPTAKADMSQEFTMLQKHGCGVVLSQAFGVYRMS